MIILPSAERDIESAFGWIFSQNEEAAIRWYNQLIEVICSLDMFPERCPLAPECRYLKKQVRQILHGRRHHKYRLLFLVTEDEVHILHVRHGARLAFGETPE